MSPTFRLIRLERAVDLASEMERRSMVRVEGDRPLLGPGCYGIWLEDMEEARIALLREGARTQQLVAFQGPSSSGREGRADLLLWGDWSRLEATAAFCSGQPFLSQIGRGMKETLEAFGCPQYRLRLRGYTLELGSRTALMGVLNITPDSFSDGGRFLRPQDAIAHGWRLVEEGADLLDLGGESTRPGSEPIPAEEEIRRILPPLRELAKASIPISVDTYKPEVARVALEEGASLINDISGLRLYPELAEVVARAGAGLVIMHMKGTPRNMQDNPQYDSVVDEVYAYLRQGIARAEEAGVAPESILVDPGLGFGKTVDHNLILLRRLREFKVLRKPLLIGPSRKSFIGKVLDLPVDQRLEGTAAVVAWGILQGASMVRVHDVKEMKRVAQMIDVLRQGS